jgi:hypothetical protein
MQRPITWFPSRAEYTKESKIKCLSVLQPIGNKYKIILTCRTIRRHTDLYRITIILFLYEVPNIRWNARLTQSINRSKVQTPPPEHKVDTV